VSDPRAEFIATCDEKLRLVRAEAELTQDQMAYAIGISKKTLVDIEKGRRTLGWTGAVALVAVFPRSSVLRAALGESNWDMIPLLARAAPAAQPSPSGSPWWERVAQNDRFIIEQNTISQHYRLLARDRTKVAASFDIDDLLPLFNAQSRE